MSDKNSKEPLHKNFFVRVGVIAVIFLGLYFIMSPYQNCVRDGNRDSRSDLRYCFHLTDW